MSEREQRRPGDRFRVTEEGPDQLRKIAQALLQAAREIDRGAVVRDYGGLVMAKGPGGSLRVSGDLRLKEVSAGHWDRSWGDFPYPEEERGRCPKCGVDAQTPVDCGEPAPTCPRFGVGEERTRPAEEDPSDGA